MSIKKDWQFLVPTMEELVVNHNPLQISSQDTILREYVLGGPNSHRDVRFLADIETLEHLIEVARRSPMKRVMIPSAGIKLKVHQARSGHIYETLHLTGHKPVPEKAPERFVTGGIDRTTFLGDSVIKDWK